jgi:hypothetical protein
MSASHWMHVNTFTVAQAAALWCEVDPSRVNTIDDMNPPEYLAVKQMLASAIWRGELRFNAGGNIRDMSKVLVERTDLQTFARERELFPRFLFDTMATFDGPVVRNYAELKNRGGRPPEYDWDTFIFEIIRRANTPDGLPEKQADLIKSMLLWFQETYGREPAESAVKDRVSKIYRYLAGAKNLGG